MKIKDTKSLCPECGKTLDAEVFSEDGKVFIKKTCDEHGEFKNTYWGNEELYNRADSFTPSITSVENPSVDDFTSCPDNCGLCSKHETSTVLGLIDVTNRCNLRCPVCFANAAAAGYKYEPSQDEIRQMLKNLRDLKPHPCLAIQYAGGEPTVRKDIVELVEMAKEEGFTHVQIATNGLRLARKEELAKQLKEAGCNTIYLAFDGVTPEPYINNRGKDLLPFKLDAIENCRKAGLGVVLVPTLIKGINDHQVGDIIKFAFDNNDIIYGVNFQPVSFASFIEPIAELISRLDGEETPKVTLNCHQHCGIATYVFRQKTEGDGKDKLIPITDFIDVEDLVNKLREYNIRLEEGKFGSHKRVLAGLTGNLTKMVHPSRTPEELDIIKILLNVFIKGDYESLGDFSKDAMLISCMHFMDPFNFDIDRVKKCVIHYATPDGRIIPFCTMNSKYRQSVEQQFAQPLRNK